MLLEELKDGDMDWHFESLLTPETLNPAYCSVSDDVLHFLLYASHELATFEKMFDRGC
jgi:hypothetical protein